MPVCRAIEQALAYGVKVFGVTVHFVDAGVDTGPVISQRAVELPQRARPGGGPRGAAPLEHALLTDAVRRFALGSCPQIRENPRRVATAAARDRLWS